MTHSDYYGIYSAIFLFAALLYSWRRRKIRLALSKHFGSANTWRKIHTYLGIWFAICLLIHTKFTLPTGLFSWWLYVLSWWVIITGALGWFLQWWLPKKLTASTSTEIVFERIYHLCVDLRLKCETITETCPAILADFYHRSCASFMAEPSFVSPIYALQMKESLLSGIASVKARLEDEAKPDADTIEAALKAKFDLDAQFTIQSILRAWIYLHAPASFVLALMVVFHIFAVIYY